MTIEISKPFEAYVAEEELPRTGDARKFAIHVPYEIEGTNRTSRWRAEWRYSGTQEEIDRKSGVDGLGPRRAREISALLTTIENDLRASGERLYEPEGRRLLVRGPIARNSGRG